MTSPHSMPPARARARGPTPPRSAGTYAAQVPLYWRRLLGNALTIIVGVSLLVLAPFELSAHPTGEQLAILALATLAIIIVDAALIGNALTPLITLKDSIDDVESPDEVPHLPVRGRDEVAAVTRAYNAMLDRLEAERIRTVRAALRSQEEERARIARELHDEVGQTMTFLLIGLRMKTEQLPEDLRAEFAQITDAARTALDEVRTISRRLRPGALADLGIGAALESVAEDARQLTGMPIDVDIVTGLGRDMDRDLVIYRVAQEAVTNIVKHAQATHASITLGHRAAVLVLTVRDNGVGTAGVDGTGSYSMRERARLVGGSFQRISTPGAGTAIVLEVPRDIAGSSVAGDDAEPVTRPLPTTTVFPPPSWLA